MAKLADKSFYGGAIVDTKDANLSIASSAVLYGLSVYSVFFAKETDNGYLAFRLIDHYKRLVSSAKMIGMDDIAEQYSYDDFTSVIDKVFEANDLSGDQFVRVTIHISQLLAGVRTSDLDLTMSVFVYEAENILPQDSAKLKTSLWRRTADTAIPARAKVNGAYVNSALAKQEAIDNGYDDCLFLNNQGFVSELSAANFFIIKDRELITPDRSSDILEGITRRSIIDLAIDNDLVLTERKLALTEVYTADEAFACGTSAFVSPIVGADNRTIGDGKPGSITLDLIEKLKMAQSDSESAWTTLL